MAPIILVTLYGYSTVDMAQAGAVDIDKLRELGLITVVPAGGVFWLCFLRFTLKTAKNTMKFWHITLFFMGNFISPLIYWFIVFSGTRKMARTKENA
jgi:hypothetical protein